MHKHSLCFVGFIAILVGLSFIPSTLHAENALPTIGAGDASLPTKIEVVVTRFYMPTEAERMKPSATPPDFSGMTAQMAIEKAVKINSDYSAKWPKCHFRIASIVPKEAGANEPEEAEWNKPMRVTLLGDNGCLTAGK